VGACSAAHLSGWVGWFGRPEVEEMGLMLWDDSAYRLPRDT
jgi:hypothetical protein